MEKTNVEVWEEGSYNAGYLSALFDVKNSICNPHPRPSRQQILDIVDKLIHRTIMEKEK